MREPYYKLRFVKFLESYNVRLKKLIYKINAPKWKLLGKTDEEHFKEFHEKCDSKNTVVLILTENDKVFGGYNDIGWLGKEKVSANQVSLKRSFLFYDLKNLFDVDQFDEDETEALF